MQRSYYPCFSFNNLISIFSPQSRQVYRPELPPSPGVRAGSPGSPSHWPAWAGGPEPPPGGPAAQQNPRWLCPPSLDVWLLRLRAPGQSSNCPVVSAKMNPLSMFLPIYTPQPWFFCCKNSNLFYITAAENKTSVEKNLHNKNWTCICHIQVWMHNSI